MGFFRRRRTPALQRVYERELAKEQGKIQSTRKRAAIERTQQKAREDARRTSRSKAMGILSGMESGLRKFNKTCDKYGLFPPPEKRKKKR